MSGGKRLTGVNRQSIVVIGIVSGSHAIHHLYLVLLPPILATLAAEFEVSLTQLGLAIGLQAFVNMTLQLPYGYLADNYDRALALGACLCLGAIGTGTVAVAPTFEWLLVGQAILGAGVAGHHPIHFPLLSDATDEGFRGRAYSVHGFAGNLGFAAPPVLIIGVTSIPGLTWRHAFGLIAVFGALYGLVVAYVLFYLVGDDVTLPTRDVDSPRDSTSSLCQRTLRELRSIGTTPSVLALGFAAMVSSTAFWGLTSYVVVFLIDGYEIPPRIAGITLTALFVAGAVFMFVGGSLSDRLQPGTVLTGAYGFLGLFLLLLASLMLSPLLAIIVAIIAGGFWGSGIPARDKLADALSSRRNLGRNFAILTIGIMIGNIVAPPLFGFLIERNGYQATFILVGMISMLASITTIIIVFTYRDEVTIV